MEKHLKLKRIVLIIILILLASFLLVWGVSLIRNEILTARYGEQFEDGYKQCNMISGIEYLKVMEYCETDAKVYYVSAHNTGADLFTFHREDGQWVMTRWETIWSTSGSASDCVWPYLRLPR